MYEAILVSCVIDKLSLFWKDFKHTLKHKKGKLTLVKLGIHLRIEKSLRAQEIDKPQSNNVAGILVVNMVELNNSTRYNDNKGNCKYQDNTKVDPNKKSKLTCWKCGKIGHLKKDRNGVRIRNKTNESRQSGSREILRLTDPKMKNLGDRGIDYIFIGYAKHYKAFRFYVIEPNEFISINSTIKSRDAIFDENIFLSIPRPSQMIPNTNETDDDIRGEHDASFGKNQPASSIGNP
ncbi:zinc finger, CCHC-type containing protein [Tanacetum coccineum]